MTMYLSAQEGESWERDCQRCTCGQGLATCSPIVCTAVSCGAVSISRNAFLSRFIHSRWFHVARAKSYSRSRINVARPASKVCALFLVAAIIRGPHVHKWDHLRCSGLYLISKFHHYGRPHAYICTSVISETFFDVSFSSMQFFQSHFVAFIYLPHAAASVADFFTSLSAEL